ncbi:hypothetical protein FDA94_29010 [Herbidospora galbida]|uniref:Uncharacterized protein n=1 Tax=Herbidospora galbida TaxID=2575442 RepID=A0A4U3MAF6_9ACTN|nr:hypothetical protein [Herbidospora galbida]TKK84657.1 hypothetical protein FDA94_29010 [Herbidospora galbida]
MTTIQTVTPAIEIRLTDIFGKVVTEGDTVVFPFRVGNTTEQLVGKVVRIVQTHWRHSYLVDLRVIAPEFPQLLGKTVTIRRWNNIVKVTA